MLTIQSELLNFSRLRFSGNARFLLIGDGETQDEQERYEIWNLPPRTRPACRASDTLLRAAEWDPARTVLCVPRDTGVKIVAPTGALRGTLPADFGLDGVLTSLEFTPTGDWLLLCSPWRLIGARRGSKQWHIEWSVKKSNRSPDRFDSAALCPDQQKLVVLVHRRKLVPHIDFTYLLVLRELTTGRILAERQLTMQEVPQGMRNRLAILPDGSATIGYRGRSVYRWPTDPTKPAKKATVSRKDIWEAVLHPSGRWLLIVSDAPEAVVWDTASWKAVRSYEWGIGRLRCAACSLNGCLAAVGSHTNKVFIWDWEL